MTFVVQMLAHTPPYVFVLLAYLIWQGALALRTRQRSVWRLLIVPVLFTATGLSLLVLRPLGGTLPMAAWLAAFAPLGLGQQGSAPSVTRLRADNAGADGDESPAATRITLRPHDPGTGEEIEKREVVKGYEYSRFGGLQVDH